MPPADDPTTHIAGRELACAFAISMGGPFEDLEGVADYDLTELGDSDVTDVVNVEGSFAVADLPAAGGVNLRISNAKRHHAQWDMVIDAQNAATPLWCRILEKNNREPVIEGGADFEAALAGTTLTVSGTAKKNLEDYLAKGMVLTIGATSFCCQIRSITDADTAEVTPGIAAPITATENWDIRHPSLQRLFEAFVSGHNLVQSRGGNLNGTLRLRGTRPIPKPTLTVHTP